MACCGSFPACGHARFTRFTDRQFQRTLGQQLIPVVDGLRDIYSQFGLRPYVVRVLRTRWTGGERNHGQERVDLVRDVLPTPRLMDISALMEVVTAVGRDEVGEIVVTEISGGYTEDELLGLDGLGQDPPEDVSAYYEIEFLRVDGLPGEKRRFQIRGAPNYMPARFQWSVRLERTRPDRLRGGAPAP
jgi:hypothetical protein